MDKRKTNVNIKNKRATFDYLITDTYTAGIVLTGTEIKSIRLQRASLVDTYCTFIADELWVKNMHIAEYSMARITITWHVATANFCSRKKSCVSCNRR